MNQTNDAIDLNLLRVFLAIWDLRSLTAAGDRLGLTQPAISHALRRLRGHFNDPLFVRATNRMLPTDAAVRLHEPLDQAFAIINRAFKERAAFDPRLTQRTFRIAMSDIAEVYSLPQLMPKLTRIAPLARIDVVPFVPDHVVAAMRSGEVDLAIGHVKNTEDCTSIDVFNDRFVCLVRAGHPMAKGRLTKASFAGLRFFYARITSPIHHQTIEQWFADRDTGSQIAVRGHFMVAPEIVRNSDLAAIFPESLALRLHQAKDFRRLDLPFDLAPIEVKVHSHSRFASDKGIRWMCETVSEILRDHV
ncbi:LysR family transcriptional regulator [Bradyrhizobium sp. CCH5-F6]|jgi:DNA-binding transcriptional LysR family regulator|uniref:LysR family transcriptional regulator n=1 Tax=Bradyrhizobium sp. CCH5-F6 TaxID=1768753 RepID=UPI00076A7FB2|nr:LysR family transcriptional regulator [Bradyrhizobium sp. CCH5-F6]